MKKKCLLPLIVLLCGPALAQAPDPQSAAEPDSGPDTGKENPASPVPYEKGEGSTNVCEDRWTNFLPIWGQAACERGYVLPRPFGVSLGYMHQDQPFDVNAIFVNGVDVGTPGVAVVDEVQNEEGTWTLRFDAWILPFWNVYGILGRTEGDADGPLRIDLNPVFPVLCSLPGNDCAVDTRFRIEYEADVTGWGTTLAGGYREFFAMVDYNRTTADLDISLTDAKATVISSRVGWNGTRGGFTGVLWLGAMYQDVAQVLDLPLDVGDDILLVSIDQSTGTAWNYLVGGQWDINRSFALLAEFGFGDRKSQMVSLTFRF